MHAERMEERKEKRAMVAQSEHPNEDVAPRDIETMVPTEMVWSPRRITRNKRCIELLQGEESLHRGGMSGCRSKEKGSGEEKEV